MATPRPGSGDGIVVVADGTRRWGRYGAAGLLVRTPAVNGEHRYLVGLRSPRTRPGGTWAIPGGALEEGEPALTGAVREFTEEIGAPPPFTLVATHVDDHGGWTYTTHLVEVAEPFPPPAQLGWETSEVRWVTLDELLHLDLLPAFRQVVGPLTRADP